jgi:hypothetical protein
MSNLLPAALTGLVTGSIAAFAVVTFTGGGATTSPIAKHAGGGEAVPAGLEEQVAALRDGQARLRDEIELRQTGIEQRLDEIVSRMTRVDVTARQPVESDDAPAASAALVADELASSGALIADPQFETAVAAAIERIEQRERAEAEEARRQRELDQIEERLASMRTTLGLDGYQETQMRTIMIENLDKANAMRDAMRNDSMSRDEIRDAFTGLRTGMEEAVAGVLSPSQYTQFQEQFSRSFGGFGDRGNRGGGGGGPGGGGFLGGGGAAPGGGF